MALTKRNNKTYFEYVKHLKKKLCSPCLDK